MKIIADKKKLIKFILKEKNLGFVPTMGAIHLGHISLIKKSINQCNKTIVSIFINKPQFNRKSDLHKYPRMLEKDISIIKKLQVDFLYLPKEKQIYPNGLNKKIKINSLENILCGKSRPGHFRAVTDVIDRFIRIIKPIKIYLGEKDMQQLLIVQDFVRRQKFKTKVIGCKTIREKNGIPYSSRNFLLSLKEKSVASKIYKSIFQLKHKLVKKQISLKILKDKIYSLGVKKIDYLEIHDVNKLIKSSKNKSKYKIFIAYYLGTTRLIDNI